jgi:hypothetical protein
LDGLVAFALVGHVATGPDEPDRCAVAISRHLADRLELSHAAVGADDPLGIREPRAVLQRALHLVLRVLAIVGMHTRQKRREGDLARLRLEPVDPIELIRPGDRVGAHVPFPAAEMGDLLRHGELVLDAARPRFGVRDGDALCGDDFGGGHGFLRSSRWNPRPYHALCSRRLSWVLRRRRARTRRSTGSQPPRGLGGGGRETEPSRYAGASGGRER